MDRGESQFIEDCFLPVDISDGQGRPDTAPVISFESSDEEEDNGVRDEEGMSSEPEVCVSLQGPSLITGVARPNVREVKNEPKCFVCLLQGLGKAPRKG